MITSTDKLDKHAVVYEHLTNLYEKQWLEIFGRLDAAMRTLIFCQAFSEMISMAQGNYLNEYFERIKRNAV